MIYTSYTVKTTRLEGFFYLICTVMIKINAQDGLALRANHKLK